MNLSVSQIKERIRKPIHKREIEEAFFFEERIRFHSIAYDKNPQWNRAFRSFMDWARDLLTTEKYERFKELFSSPVPTTELTNQIFSHYLKIFESSNSRKDYFFDSNNSEEDKAEFMTFLENNAMIWRTEAWHEFRNYICSFMVIDLPTKEQQENGEKDPYMSFVHIDDVVDAKIDNKSNVHYLIYKIGYDEDCIYVYLDNKKYIVLNKNLQKTSEVVHGFGETPSRQFWTSNINDNYFKKKSPLSYLLGRYDYLLFHEVSKEFPELYAKFPIMSEYAEDETNKDYENSILEHTHNSSSYNNMYEYTLSDGRIGGHYNREKRDDKKNKDIGAGSTYTKSIPEEGQPDIGAVVEFISPPIENLEYINENLKNRRAEIYTSATGSVPDFKNDQAKNEKQVQDQHESEKNILIEIKTNFELAEQWATDFFGRVKYKDAYKGSVINYGTNFYLVTPSDIQNDIASFKEIGMPESILLDKQSQFLETIYKTDAKALSRAKLLLELDPFPTMSIKEVAELAKTGGVDEDMYDFKVQLPALIKQYERTYSDIDNNLVVDGDDVDSIKEALLDMFNPKSKEDDGRSDTGEETER